MRPTTDSVLEQILEIKDLHKLAGMARMLH